MAPQAISARACAIYSACLSRGRMTPPPLQEVMASPRAPVLEDATRAALQNKEINILVIGCYHVGKSTLINTLFFDGEEKAREGA